MKTLSWRKLAYFFSLIGCLETLGGSVGAQTTSPLWGSSGKSWEATSRLPDFSFAGYHMGERKIPSPRVVKNVKTDFGAKGDGKTDDSKAFLRAIAAVSEGTIYIPAGRYKITKVLRITKSNIVLRGAGRNKSVLVFPKSLLKVVGRHPGSGKTGNWSWEGGFIRVEGYNAGKRLTSVTAPAKRGDFKLTVAKTSRIKVGQIIRLLQTDKNGTLGRHLHADQQNVHPNYVGDNLVDFAARVKAVAGNKITLERPLRVDVQRRWKPEIYAHHPSVKEVGIEGLSLEFPSTRYRGHLAEVGYNGIVFKGVSDSWIRNITIKNGDNGIQVEGGSRWVTVDGVRFLANSSRRNRGMSGHHGIETSNCHDSLFSNFRFQTKYVHDITVQQTTGNVFMEGSGESLNFDHHTHYPMENLFTKINVGSGERFWLSSGNKGPHSAARSTFWNITARQQPRTIPAWPQINVVGIGTSVKKQHTEDRAWVDPIAPSSLTPDNLYKAQLAYRRAGKLRASASPEEGSVKVNSILLVNAATKKVITTLTNDSVITRSNLPPFNICATMKNHSATKKVVMNINGTIKEENGSPFCVGSNTKKQLEPWKPLPGSYTLAIEAVDKSGKTGTERRISFRVQ